MGWVKRVFETLLKKPVRVELEKAIGFGDDAFGSIVHGRILRNGLNLI